MVSLFGRGFDSLQLHSFLLCHAHLIYLRIYNITTYEKHLYTVVFYKHKCYLTLRIIEKIYKIIRCSDKELKKICVYSPFFVFLQGKGGTHGRSLMENMN